VHRIALHLTLRLAFDLALGRRRRRSRPLRRDAAGARQEFAAEYHRELNRLNATRESAYARQQEEFARVQRQLRALSDAIKEGLRTPGMLDP
jgi:hypothetical protein